MVEIGEEFKDDGTADLTTNVQMLAFSQTSGTTSATIHVNVAQHTGRVARTGTFSVSGKSASHTVTVNQSGATEFISLTTTSAQLSKSGGQVTIKGTSNVAGLAFCEKANASGNVARVSSYGNIKVIGDTTTTYTGSSNTETGYQSSVSKTWTNNEGKSNEYAFEAIINIGENTTTGETTCTIEVKKPYSPLDKTTILGKQFTITVSAGDSYINVTDTTFDVGAEGGTVDVGVETNDNWKIN